MALNQEYLRKLLPFEYLDTLWNSVNDTWTQIWNSDAARELTKPHALKLFGLSALLGAIFPILIMILWKVFNRRKDETSKYKQLDEQSLGSFNTKVLENIKGKRNKQKEPENFDPIQPKVEHHKSKKRHSKGGDKHEAPSPQNTSTNEKKHEKKLKKAAKNKESTKLNESTELNSTRLQPPDFTSSDFKLNDEEVNELSHMEFHGKLKSATLKARANKLEEAMSAEEREKESQLKMQQLESIFKLMQDEGKFGIESKEELMDQFKIYS